MDAFKNKSVRDLFPPEPTLRDSAWKMFVTALRRHKRTAGICLGAALMVGAACLVFIPSLLETSSTVHVEVADLSQPGMEATASSLLAEQPEVMRSTPVIAMAIASSRARGLPLLQGRKNLVEYIKSNLSVRSSGQTGVYDLTLTSSYPADAEKILDALVAAYIRFEASPPAVGATQASALREQRQKADNDLVTARQQLADVIKRQKVLNPTPESHERLVQERAELAAALADSTQKHDPRDAVQARFTLLSRQSQENDALDDEAASLQADVERLTSLSDGLGERLRHWDHLQENQVSIALLKPPETDSTSVWPRPWPILGISLLAGLLLAGVVVFVLDLTSIHLQDAEDATTSAKTPVLGRLPAMAEDLSSAVLRGQCVLVKPAHPAAQACRGIRATLESLLVAGVDKTILVTGPGNAQGKSVLASNLAIAMARSGQRVALVDAHHQLPMVNRIFGIEDRVGLNNAIEGKLRISDVLHVTGLHGLEVLPAGSSDADWSELFNRPAFMEVLTELSDRFDRVIIDGGPATIDESRIISAFCDATILAVDARRCRRRDLRSAAQGLRAVGAKLVGIVLNDLPQNRAGAKAPLPQDGARHRLTPVPAGHLAETA